MKTITTILLLVGTMATGIALQGQTTITRDEFWTAYRSAFKKLHENSRRQVRTSETYVDGMRVEVNETITENLLPDKYRFISTTTSSDGSRKIEMVKIDKTIYCRKNNGAWIVSTTWCSGEGSGSGGPFKITSSSFTLKRVELGGKSVRKFEEYTIYKNVHSPTKDKEGLSFWNSTYWLDDDGLIVAEERRIGLIDPVRTRRATRDMYEYNPNIKIQAPIK